MTIAGAVAALITLLLTPLAGKLASRVGAMDKPDARRVHLKPTPRLGGLAVFGGIIITLSLTALGAPSFFQARSHELIVLIIGALLIIGIGILDDVYSMRASFKLAGQIIVGLVMSLGGLRLESISWPFAASGTLELSFWSHFLTVFWVVGLMNAVNIIDGLDGLCSGICAIASIVLASIIFGYDQSILLLIPVLTAGACLGFLFHNYHPAKIFLGDTGSLLLGYLLAYSTLATGTKSTAVLTLLIPLLCIAVPVVDIGIAIIRRTRRGQHPFAPDKEHIHHRLLSLGLSQKRVVWILWFVTAYLGLTAYTLEKAEAPLLTLLNASFLFCGLLLLIENVAFLSVLRARESAELNEYRVHERTSNNSSSKKLATSISDPV